MRDASLRRPRPSLSPGSSQSPGRSQSRQHRQIQPLRPGQTLVELLVSMTAATFLMGGLGSCLMLATRSFDGNFTAAERARAAEVQGDLITDLQQAKSFLSRSPEAVSFRVPDRDSDGLDETLSYAWSGLPEAELRYSKNGSDPVAVLKNVNDFELTFMNRELPGPALPPVDPNDWGKRWALSTFGNDVVYGSIAWGQASTAAMRVRLNESGTLKSISACLAVAGDSDVRMAIYDTTLLGTPRNLLASTAVVRVNAPGWVEISAPSTHLSAGNYYLAISIKDTTKVACRYQADFLSQAYLQNRDSTSLGFLSSWGWPGSSTGARGSIKASYVPD